jgi:pimeloyl-ACP methyl ester carboxylesterase
MNLRKLSIIFFASLLIQTALLNNSGFNPVHGQGTNDGKVTISDISDNKSNNFSYGSPQEVKKTKVGDIDIAYKMFGKGDPLLLIMGYGGSMNNWDPILLKKLSESHVVIVFDNRGVSNTESGNKSFTISQFAHDTVGLMNALHINKTDLLGFSMGGFIAQYIALNYPEKINHLVIYASNCGGHESTLPPTNDLDQNLQNRSRSFEDILNGVIATLFPIDWIQKNPKEVEQVKAGFRVLPVISMETIQKQADAISSWYENGVCNQLETIDKPSLVLVGAKDILTPQNNSITIAENIPNSWLVRIQEGGHGVMYQYPDKLYSILEAFLK